MPPHNGHHGPPNHGPPQMSHQGHHMPPPHHGGFNPPAAIIRPVISVGGPSRPSFGPPHHSHHHRPHRGDSCLCCILL